MEAKVCKYGHVVNDANTVWNSNGKTNFYRRCLTCKREHDRKYGEKRKAQRRAATAAKRQQRDDRIRQLHVEGRLSLTKIANTVGTDLKVVKAAIDPEFRRRELERKRKRHHRLKQASAKTLALMERHSAAMRIVADLTVEERYSLLYAVVWPQTDELLNLEREAA